ncbi:MAG TPA: glycosyltransferase family 2 protein [Verrucomicrobiae bacterium]|nr:glycosyltransferase family 2 protein [Verrucomicrobiae bacterium]
METKPTDVTVPALETRPHSVSHEALLSVVIPCYNEQDVLPLMYKRLTAAAAEWPIDYEVILVNDGSRDNTWQVMTQIHEADRRWKMICLARNFGHQVALWTGLTAARGDAVVVLDADLQDPPELVPQFLKRWTEGVDVVYGVRRRRKESLLKRACYFLYYRVLATLSEVEIPLDSGDFCLMDRRVVQVISSAQDSRPFIRGLRAWVGFRQESLPYERSARAAGQAKYTVTMLMKLAVDGILSSSIRPLRLATYLGLFVSAFAFLGTVFTLAQRVFEGQFARIGLRPVPGFATTVISILFLGGVQLLCVGILGEYIGRIYENIKGRPVSTVARTLGVGWPSDEDGTGRSARP